jgi:conserved repeat domain
MLQILWMAAAFLAGPRLLRSASAPVSDDFNTTNLNTSLWTFVNPVGDGTLSFNGTEALLSVPAGRAHDLWTAGNASARILQAIGNVDFTVEAKFDSAPQTSIQDEGIIVAADASNYIRFDVYYSGAVYFFSSSFVNNKPTVYSNPKLGATVGAPLWLRVQRQGNVWTGSWSTDGINFITVANFTYAITVAQIGPFVANNGSSAPAFTAKVDYFHNIGSSGIGVPDLTIRKAHAGNFTAGATGAYTLTVNNAGTAASNGVVTVTDALPAGLTPAGASGSGWICTTSGQTVTCSTMNSIATGVSAPAITVAVNVLSGAPGNVTNTASVSGGGESNTANNSASDLTIITGIGVKSPVSDDFHSNVLNTSLWNFVNPVGNGTVSLDGTHALLTVPAGSSHDVWTTGNNSARIMQFVANQDFDVTAKFDSGVDQACQSQGLLFQQDTANFVRIDAYSSGTYVKLFAATFANGIPTIQLNSVLGDELPLPFYLRVRRTGDTFSYLTSIDGQTYTEVAHFVYHLVVNQMGPFASNNACGYVAPAFTSSVDYFFNSANPIVPQDGILDSNPIITLWYGDNQTFGQLGIPQPWVNVLGTILSPNGIIRSAWYTLNGGAPQPLSIGANSWRLVQPGDFNAEIAYANLNPGANTVVITAIDVYGNQTSHTVTVNYVAGQTWPAAYSIPNWSQVSNIQNVVQVIDGKWKRQSDGTIRTDQVGYDRLLTLGNMSTWQNYAVSAEFTLHFISDANIPSPANHNDSDCGIGILVGWKGHTNTPPPNWPTSGPVAQPNFGHPFPAIGWYSSAGGKGLVLQMYENTPTHPEREVVYQPSAKPPLLFETKYVFKMQVQRHTGKNSSRYSFKAWPASTTEPTNWTLQFDGDLGQGSVVLAAHRSDVSIGAVNVSPVSALPN